MEVSKITNKEITSCIQTIRYLQNVYNSVHTEMAEENTDNCEKIIEVLNAQKLCEDCISRSEALNAIENEKLGWYGVERYAIDGCHSRIMHLPSVKPRQKRGKWIEQNDTSKHHFGWYYCSECGAYIMSTCNYCSECGTDMRGETDAD